jgi:hypothetical protein
MTPLGAQKRQLDPWDSSPSFWAVELEEGRVPMQDREGGSPIPVASCATGPLALLLLLLL